MKKLLAIAAIALSSLLAPTARAGTYLDTAALLLDTSRRSNDWLQSRLFDVKLAILVHQMAEARVHVGRAIIVPHDVERAHPHLLLALEGAERATAAAAEGDGQRFLRLIVQAREEERTYRAILADQKLTLPEIEKCEKK